MQFHDMRFLRQNYSLELSRSWRTTSLLEAVSLYCFNFNNI